jgi:DNA polymerase II small subunit
MLEPQQKKKEIVSFLLKKKVLVTPSFLTKLGDPARLEQLYSQLSQPDAEQLLAAEATGSSAAAGSEQKNQYQVKVLWDYKEKEKKRTIQDFVNYFNARYKLLEKMLSSRPELESLTSIGRLANKKDREAVSVIGMVGGSQVTANGNIILKVEDATGEISVFFSKNKQELFESAKDIMLDEVIGVTGASGDKIIFANSFVFPDIPVQTELKKANDEAYAAILSDTHVGSSFFLEEAFSKFLKWIRCETGSDEQKAVAQKTRYIFILGDLVDGVGIYPGMEYDLKVLDVREQYRKCAELLKQIPSHIKLIICPGNHDVGRISEPQPKLSEEYANPVYELPNVIMTCNPTFVNIHSSQDFPGFNFLLYHGYSYDFYAETVPSIKNSGRHLSDRTGLVMKYMLQRRHLAPTHTTTLYIPDAKTDPLVIETVPDFFISGHLHKSVVTTYRGVTIICGSCWQSQTPFQEKVGHVAEPGKVPLINLKTREVKLMNFA